MNSCRPATSLFFSCCITTAVLFAIGISAVNVICSGEFYAIDSEPVANDIRSLDDEAWEIGNVKGVGAALKDPCSAEVSKGLEAARNQYRLLARVREFNILMEIIRSKLHRSAHVENWMDQPGVSKVMQETRDQSEELRSQLSIAGKFAGNSGGITPSNSLAKRGAELADLPVRLVNAVETSQTSSGSKRLRDLKRVIKDSRKILGMVESLGPGIGRYHDVLIMAIEDIAANAEQIEENISEPNSFVEQLDEVLERTRDIDREPTKLDNTLESIGSELRARERQCDPEAYAEVADAEEPCLARFGLDLMTLGYLRYRITAKLPGAIAQLESVIYKLETGSNDLRIQTIIEQERLWYLETVAGGAGTLSSRLSASGEIPAQKLKILRLEDDVRRFEASKDEKLAAAKQRLGNYEKELAGSGMGLSEFHDCVQDGLRTANHADITYLTERFPQYTENN